MNSNPRNCKPQLIVLLQILQNCSKKFKKDQLLLRKKFWTCFFFIGCVRRLFRMLSCSFVVHWFCIIKLILGKNWIQKFWSVCGVCLIDHWFLIILIATARILIWWINQSITNYLQWPKINRMMYGENVLHGWHDVRRFQQITRLTCMIRISVY